MQALLALEDGRIFYGRSFGHHTEVGAEIVFCTAMSGYQEILTDPSYHGQFVVFTAPHIGNYGIHLDHQESARAWAAGVIIRDLCEHPAHPESMMSLRRYVRERRLSGLDGIDTRALTLHLRERGVMRAYITNRVHDPDEAVALARQFPPMSERSLVADVTSPRLHEYVPGGGGEPHLALLDYGVKESIMRQLTLRGCSITILPAYTEPAILDLVRPDGVVLSNGPGDPEALISVVGTVRHAIDRYPTLAICLGHQLVGLALGARIQKLRFGHHGANHPVQDLRSGFVSITSQNHNYAVEAETLPKGIEVSHVSLNDGTVEGLVDRGRRLWSYQFHPEGAPGPHDARAIFDDFIDAVCADMIEPGIPDAP